MKVRPEVQAIVENCSKVLLVKKNNVWRLPKGGVEENEEQVQALTRELKEEILLKNHLKIQKLNKYSFITPGVTHEVCVFIVSTDQKEIQVDHNELTEAKWVSPVDAIVMLQLKEEKESMRAYIEVKR